MPANFDSPLTISNTATGGSGFVDHPTGPLGHVDGKTIVRVEVWLMQQSTGAVQMTYSTTFPHGSTTWTADKKWYPQSAHWSNGLFKPGAALGTAVLVSRKNNKQSVYWWTEEVELTY